VNRITEVLRDSAGFTRADFERLQHDELSPPARELVPVLLAAAQRRTLAPLETSQLGILRGWDFVMRKDQAAPLLYFTWYRALRTRVLDRLLGPLAQSAGGSIGTGWILSRVMHPDASFGPRPAELRDSLMTAALADAAASLVKEYGPDPARWAWGAVHQARFRHPLAAAFDLPSAARGGEANTINSTSGPGTRQTHGASYRIVVDFSDFDNTTATSVPGQSGQPGSEYYGNLLPLWAEGKYFPLLYSRGAVERETVHLLWLMP
jgi:penicillin amidase